MGMGVGESNEGSEITPHLDSPGETIRIVPSDLTQYLAKLPGISPWVFHPGQGPACYVYPPQITQSTPPRPPWNRIFLKYSQLWPISD